VCFAGIVNEHTHLLQKALMGELFGVCADHGWVKGVLIKTTNGFRDVFPALDLEMDTGLSMNDGFFGSALFCFVY
jgi:hypothetical protein